MPCICKSNNEICSLSVDVIYLNIHHIKFYYIILSIKIKMNKSEILLLILGPKED